MIPRNKNFLTFFSLAVFLATMVLIALQRFYPLFQHSIYYCQAVIRSLFLHFPHEIAMVAPFFLSVFVLVAGVKFYSVFIQTRMLSKKLLSQTIPHGRLHAIITKLGLDKKTYVIASDKPFAFCFGIRDPKIYLSTTTVNIMDSKELEAILLHEKYHLDNKDTFTMLCASLCQSLFPFFPLVNDLLRNYRIEREIAADQQATFYLGSSKPIISVLKKLLLAPSLAESFVPAIADQDTLESRINALVQKNVMFKKFHRVNIFFSMLSVLTLLIIILSPVYATEIHSDGQNFMLVCTAHFDT